jgi:hypothetical protein
MMVTMIYIEKTNRLQKARRLAEAGMSNFIAKRQEIFFYLKKTPS